MKTKIINSPNPMTVIFYFYVFFFYFYVFMCMVGVSVLFCFVLMCDDKLPCYDGGPHTHVYAGSTNWLRTWRCGGDLVWESGSERRFGRDKDALDTCMNLSQNKYSKERDLYSSVRQTVISTHSLSIHFLLTLFLLILLPQVLRIFHVWDHGISV